MRPTSNLQLWMQKYLPETSRTTRVKAFAGNCCLNVSQNREVLEWSGSAESTRTVKLRTLSVHLGPLTHTSTNNRLYNSGHMQSCRIFYIHLKQDFEWLYYYYQGSVFWVWVASFWKQEYRISASEKLPDVFAMSNWVKASGSKTDWPLAKAEPSSDGSSVSGIMYKGGEKKLPWERNEKKCERKSSAYTKVSVECGGGGAPDTLHPVVKTVVNQLCPFSPWRPMGIQRSTCNLCWTPCQSRRMPKGSCYSVGSPCWSRLLAGPVSSCRMKPTLNQVFWQHLWPCGGLRL